MIVKLCGMFRKEDIMFANETKPDFIGFILDFPQSHRSLTPAQAASLKLHLDPSIKAVGVFVNSCSLIMIELVKKNVIDVIQLHGDETNEQISQLKAKVYPTPIWKAFRLTKDSNLDEINHCPADLIIVDNGYGTGKCFDWSLLEHIHRPYLLAGGISTQNLATAIKEIHPYGFDLSSGIETNKIKDFNKMQMVVNICRDALKEERK